MNMSGIFFASERSEHFQSNHLLNESQHPYWFIFSIYLSTLRAFRITLTMWASWFAQFFRTWNRQLLHMFHQQLIATNCSQEEVFLSCFDSFWFSVLSSVSRSPSVSFSPSLFLFRLPSSSFSSLFQTSVLPSQSCLAPLFSASSETQHL